MLNQIKLFFSRGRSSQSLGKVDMLLRAAIDRQFDDGRKKQEDAYWSSGGHNVGSDVIEAINIATRTLEDLARTEVRPSIQAAIHAVTVAHQKYCESAKDGYGSATLGGLLTDLSKIEQQHPQANFTMAAFSGLLPPTPHRGDQSEQDEWFTQYVLSCSSELQALLEAYAENSLQRVIGIANQLQTNSSDPNWVFRLQLLMFSSIMRNMHGTGGDKSICATLENTLRATYTTEVAVSLVRCILGELDLPEVCAREGQDEVRAMAAYYLGARALMLKQTEEAARNFEACLNLNVS